MFCVLCLLKIARLILSVIPVVQEHVPIWARLLHVIIIIIIIIIISLIFYGNLLWFFKFRK